MKKRTTNRDAGHLHYESPSMVSVSVKSEGILCQSEETLLDETPYLQDYNPSNGVW